MAGRPLSPADSPRREITIRKRDEPPVPCWDHWAISIADFDAEQVHQALVKWGIDGVGLGRGLRLACQG